MNVTNDDHHLTHPSTSLSRDVASESNKPRKKRRTVSFPKPEKMTTTAGGDDSAAVSRACTECGKEFFSRKALYGHMRCHPERDWRGINPPRRRSPLPQEISAAVDEYEIATCLLLLAAGGGGVVFECASCKKVFRSHQALGGHRASHKNVKGCFAMAARSSTPNNVNNEGWACGGGPSSSSAHGGHGLGLDLDLDLNLPAAAADDAVDEEECCYSSLSSCDYLDLRLAL